MIYSDQLGCKVNLKTTPKRIVSLVPSQTELLFDLGLNERIVGVTRFCVKPEDKVKNKTIIGGTKKFNFKKIADLKPDLIIGNKEENYPDGIEELKRSYAVWMSDIITFVQALEMIQSVGDICNRETEAKKLIDEILSLKNSYKPLNKIPALYMIWKGPYMVAAADTFINEMLNICGFDNCLKDQKRYPVISEKEIKQINPEVILLSSEPYPFKEKHVLEFHKLLPGSKILIADGTCFSWYGSRLKESFKYFTALKTKIENTFNN